MHLSIVLLLTLMLMNVNAHLCIYDPPQRGPKPDISKPSATCFRATGPCGKFPPEIPKVILTINEKFTFHFQQNLNHFTVGNPGYIDVAISKNPVSDKPETDADFDVIDGFVPDYFAHAEWRQTNMTYEMLVPQVQECEHCVVRFRYITHKPGEPIFHQCVDVKIVKSSTSNSKRDIVPHTLKSRTQSTLRQSTKDSVQIFGIFANIQSTSPANFVKISTDGITPLITLNHYVRTYKKPYHISETKEIPRGLNDGIVTYDEREKNLYYTTTDLGPDPASLDTLLFRINIENRTFKNYGVLKIPVSCLHYDIKWDTLISVAIVNSSQKEGNYEYKIYKIDKVTAAMTLLTSTPPDNYFIDFVWSEYDVMNQTLYILARNEHDPLNQTQKIIIIDIANEKVVDIFQVDYQHSFSSMHYIKGLGLYAITQGIPFKQEIPFKFELYKIIPEKRTTEFVYRFKTDHMQDWAGQVRNLHGGPILYQIFRTADNQQSLYSIDVTNVDHKPDLKLTTNEFQYLYNPIVL